MNRPGSQSSTLDATHRRSWPIILGAFTATPLIYVGLAWYLRRGQTVTPVLPEALRTLFFGMAVAGFVGAIIWTRLRMSGETASTGAVSTPASPAPFQTAMVIACSLAETPAICGFVLALLGAPLTDLYLLAGSSVAAMVGIVVPAVLRYLGGISAGGPVSPGT